MDTARSDAVVEHEATTTRISEERLFYCEQRGIDPQDATALIVGGFCQAVLESCRWNLRWRPRPCWPCRWKARSADIQIKTGQRLCIKREKLSK
jgi:hypothetical protein